MLEFRCMKMPHDLTAQEIRLLQEFRRLETKELGLEEIRAVKHPTGHPEAPVAPLVEKGFLTYRGGRLALTPRAEEFLSYDPKP